VRIWDICQVKGGDPFRVSPVAVRILVHLFGLKLFNHTARANRGLVELGETEGAESPTIPVRGQQVPIINFRNMMAIVLLPFPGIVDFSASKRKIPTRPERARGDVIEFGGGGCCHVLRLNDLR
jgi:hypothetical protein